MPSRLSPLNRGAAVLALTTAFLVPQPVRGASEEWLKKQTVQLEVVNTSQDRPVHGSGVILCQQGDFAYILTAKHVIYGDSKTNSTKDVESVTIRFYPDRAGKKYDIADLHPAPAKVSDLVLLTVDVPEHRRLAAKVSLGASPRLPVPVTAIGYPGSSEGWVVEEGKFIKKDNDGNLIHSVSIEEGFSGGPLFDSSSGELIGLNIKAAPLVSEARKADENGLAVPIDQIRREYRTSTQSCLSRLVDEKDREEAFSLYKEAVEYIALERWKDAVDKLKAAIDKKYDEGGSLHLQGMRYSIYLPHYQLGVAYFKQGCFVKASEELGNSKDLEAIRGNRRYRRLKNLLKEADRHNKESNSLQEDQKCSQHSPETAEGRAPSF